MRFWLMLARLTEAKKVGKVFFVEPYRSTIVANGKYEKEIGRNCRGAALKVNSVGCEIAVRNAHSIRCFCSNVSLKWLHCSSAPMFRADADNRLRNNMLCEVKTWPWHFHFVDISTFAAYDISKCIFLVMTRGNEWFQIVLVAPIVISIGFQFGTCT